MLRGIEVIIGWTGSVDDEVVLDYDDRRRRRVALTGEGGTEFLLDLPDTPDLRDGDAILLSSGKIVRVRAASEPLLEIGADQPAQLARIAWHLGNRHLAVEIRNDRIRVRSDHVIAAMVKGLGGEVNSITAPFHAERGAYAKVPASSNSAKPRSSVTVTIMDSVALYRLMIWFSPSFPVGAYSYSHGLEWLVEKGEVHDVESLVGWLEDILRFGSGRNDAILFAHAHRSVAASNMEALCLTAQYACAFTGSAERRLETTAQGRAFADAILKTWGSATLEKLLALSPAAIAYPVAVAVATADHRIPLSTALYAYLNGFTANLVSAGARLIPLGQSDAQRALLLLEPHVAQTAAQALEGDLAMLGGSAVLADVASMKHETQYTRLFRT